jgi:hypothetical protein
VDNFEFDEPILICEEDFESTIKIQSVLVNGKAVKIREPFIILDEDKSFFAIEINHD